MTSRACAASQSRSIPVAVSPPPALASCATAATNSPDSLPRNAGHSGACSSTFSAAVAPRPQPLAGGVVGATRMSVR
jgi:hypothetical protein